ncbi:myb/SANT-like DNA-binding domain-containing protein 2 [Malaclemys terrapin pileata]|uniref:myb/SANT-like DNA-binding domain-containing protein 2 n=1 Tax=Malaclemys terrapin pileata TaxID=2991368 RepID=UPI0023A7E408|nr:myb/SANT-like DNA-binding domain-containing protein 2 [Malaclemys terrapin pileata]
MQADNRKRAPAWTVWEVLDLIAIWGEDSVLAELRSKRRNAKTFEKISKGMMERGHNRDSDQCRVKVKELRQAYQKTKEANGRSGSEPRTCCFYAELHAILGGAATTTPSVIVDSGSGIVSSATPEDSADGGKEEEEEEELAESTQHSVLPNSQDLFLTLTEVPSQPSQASIQDRDPMEGTSAAANSSSLPPPSRRLSQIRRRKKKTRDEMFSEIMESSRSDRAHLNEWKETVSKYRKEASEREERRDQREERRDARDERWRQEDQRRQDATLGLLREQTDMLRRLVELQERLQENRLPLQPLYSPPSSPCSVSSSPRRVRTRGGGSIHLPIPPQ